MTDSKEPEGEKKPPDERSWAELSARLGAVVSMLAILAFFGIKNVGQVWHTLIPQLAHTATPMPSVPTFSYSPLPVPSFSPLPVPSFSPIPVPTTSSPISTPPPSSGHNLKRLNSEATDPTPFTAGALLPSSFTGSEGIQYHRVASSSHPCGEAAFVNSYVQSILNDYHCGSVMSGDYLIRSRTVTADNNVLVSVQVMPLYSSLAAQNAYASFPPNGKWDFGIWCPTRGIGSGDCSRGYLTAQRYQVIQTKYRYLIEATAVYVNLTSDSGAQPFIKSAVIAAVAASGPENYPGNQP